MAQRDLTYNSPNVPQDGEQNPFASPQDEDLSSSFGSNHISSSQLDDTNFHYGKPFSSYNGYYLKNGTSSNLLSHETSLEGNNAQNSDNNIQVPSEYDRYPLMAGSRVVSSTSLSSHLYQNKQTPKSDDTSLSSNKSTNPFIAATDFSPFGGYPASSFPLHIDEKEPDDYLHNPDPIADALYDKNRFMYDLKNMDRRSMGGLFGIIFLVIAVICVFILFPVLTYSGVADHYTPESYEILTHYKYPILSAIRTSLVDPDTPDEYLTRKVTTGTWKLVFSDEFNKDGRTFYDGDDQFFTAPNFHYAATHDLEWYDPDAVWTENGTLNLRMDAFKNHDLFYRSGMVQSWNKMCFTQGMIEFSAQLPNYGNVSGLWPGLWTMGNLGRPGYMATTDGVWPYTYEACDAGITANQSSPDGISYLPGQRLPLCACSGLDHPNVGTGRGAPEIDALEAEYASNLKLGLASQSMQIAPFDIWYIPDYNFASINDDTVTSINSYAGGPFQQAVSGVTTLNNAWYEKYEDPKFQMYGYEYLNDDDDGYCTWYVGEPTLTVKAYALGPNGNIDFRRISKEPMSVIMNLGISNNWAYIDWPSLNFPVTMRIDHVRVYQPEDQISVTCDPEDHPTYQYIQDHLNAYENVNLTSWEDAGYSFPKNKLLHGC
ncbi:beta-glucan synthesis-associated protein [Naganishia cerealis]|uniref:Beta-glucan synthesis-associated protein n=1 Tax=Naganishia cerealis TaxID=610337 RepID=A0ACC2WSB5_9TREE|nr:beta-glucan synthesis-associated protein [Naganishia cerealis]